MESLLSASQIRLRQEARSLAESLLREGAEGRDRSAAFPSEEIRALARRGYLGMTGDPSHGGQGWDRLAASLVLIELARGCASTALVVGFHALVVCEAISRSASSALKSRHLPSLLRGESLGALAMSDPSALGAPPDPATAWTEGDRLILRGSRESVPGATAADLFLVYAQVGSEQDGGDAGVPRTRRETTGVGASSAADASPRRRALLLVPRGTPGLRIGPGSPPFGVRAAGVADVRFDECVVPSDQELAPPGEPRAVSGPILADADLVVASQAVGIAEEAFEKAVVRTKERDASGAHVGSRQSIQWKLADMQVLLDAARLFCLRAAIAADRGEAGYAREAAQAKCFAGRAAARIADEAVQVFGSAGAIADGGIERHWRDAKTTELNPTSREAALLSMARSLLGGGS